MCMQQQHYVNDRPHCSLTPSSKSFQALEYPQKPLLLPETTALKLRVCRW